RSGARRRRSRTRRSSDVSHGACVSSRGARWLRPRPRRVSRGASAGDRVLRGVSDSRRRARLGPLEAALGPIHRGVDRAFHSALPHVRPSPSVRRSWRVGGGAVVVARPRAADRHLGASGKPMGLLREHGVFRAGRRRLAAPRRAWRGAARRSQRRAAARGVRVVRGHGGGARRGRSRGGTARVDRAPAEALLRGRAAVRILAGVNARSDTVVVLDFGSQYTQVIARRIREARVRSVVLPIDAKAEKITQLAPKGIIHSGGPSSVYDREAPRGDEKLFDLGVPVFGLCYGMMWIAQRFGGRVGSAPGREYGRAVVPVSGGSLFRGIGPVAPIWMSHGDHVETAPVGFAVTAHTENAPVAAFEDAARGLYGIQGHPEVHHSEHGAQMLENFLYDVCGAKPTWTMAGFRDATVARLRNEVKHGLVLGALSGGGDSPVAAVLTREAVGERFRGVFVDTGLLRKDEGRQVLE